MEVVFCRRTSDVDVTFRYHEQFHFNPNDLKQDHDGLDMTVFGDGVFSSSFA